MKVVELLGSSGADVGQMTTDGHTASALSKADMFTGYRYTQSLLVPEDLEKEVLGSTDAGPASEEESIDTEDGQQPNSAQVEELAKAREQELEGARAKELARMRAEEKRKRLEQEQALQAQMQRNLMAAAGMHM